MGAALYIALKIFGMDNDGVAVDVVLVKKRWGPEGKGRAARALGLTHFVDNDLTCLWSCCQDKAGNCRDTLEQHTGRLIWFDVDLPPVHQEDLDDKLLREVNRYRDHDAMEKWVSAAATWTCVSELLGPRVAEAVQAGWDHFRDNGPPRKQALAFGEALDKLHRCVRDLAHNLTPRRPLRPPSPSRAASTHSSRQAGSASHPQAGSASRPQAGPASQRPPRSASHSPPSPAGAPAAQVPSVAPDAPAEAPQPDAEAAVDWDPWEFPPLSPERVPGMPARPPGMPAMMPRATAAEPMDR